VREAPCDNAQETGHYHTHTVGGQGGQGGQAGGVRNQETRGWDMQGKQEIRGWEDRSRR